MLTQKLLHKCWYQFFSYSPNALNSSYVLKQFNEYRLWHIRTAEYCLAIKRDILLIHTAIWKNLKCCMLSEGNQFQKAAYCIILLICHYGKWKTMLIENKSSSFQMLRVLELLTTEGLHEENFRREKCCLLIAMVVTLIYVGAKLTVFFNQNFRICKF